MCSVCLNVGLTAEARKTRLHSRAVGNQTQSSLGLSLSLFSSAAFIVATPPDPQRWTQLPHTRPLAPGSYSLDCYLACITPVVVRNLEPPGSTLTMWDYSCRDSDVSGSNTCAVLLSPTSHSRTYVACDNVSMCGLSHWVSCVNHNGSSCPMLLRPLPSNAHMRGVSAKMMNPNYSPAHTTPVPPNRGLPLTFPLNLYPLFSTALHADSPSPARPVV